ncbi:MAG TPA: bifunctional DNA-formamidopyrimidine glycosylase/DNA-(apurinic or apyrimidinic site) lyase, partial [candidate division WOR-3 bacterium]|nr:bifunctional DNA-formamidopyrimidine glycosylase/DNA-(apurinic or apyrimidinic site) lyase [candidate division WOR-3 bacterium]
MPELPEVETIRRELEPLLAGRRIAAVEVRRPDIVGWPGAGRFASGCQGRRIERVGRRGKYLIIGLDAGFELVIHLRLSGHLQVVPARAAVRRHERVRFRLSGGRALVFVEPRALGRLYLVERGKYPAALAGMRRMGPEPVERAFTSRFLSERLAGRKAAVKTLLLDQSVCCGVGNIYSDEALFRAGIRPDRPAGGLRPEEIRRLADNLRRVLRSGIRWCGTTLGDGRYRRPDTTAGGFQRHLYVYGRADEPCRRPWYPDA